ncbi:MAG TPA: pantoate--beta-alanine ligase [Syntrophomonadaceae bacterium]|nr:pantoate--beta-alanine ligase [Syntrophomonadaceae bacterium]
MQVFHSINQMQDWCLEQKYKGKKIGLVPTMGCLHEGHLALVQEACRQCDVVVVSIFVNPIQFGVGEDFDRYPRDLVKDRELLETTTRADLIFAPSIQEMYPPGYQTSVDVTGEITEKLCGASRPGHFRGVSTVVSKLFLICQPDLAFFGQKDAQQVAIIEKMVRDLNFPLQIVRVPIVREVDGLALSSRNIYLDDQQRQEALVLNQALKTAEQAVRDGERDVNVIREILVGVIEKSPQARIDYAEVYRAEDLADLPEIKGRVLMAVAVKFGNTRLIDNRLVEV